LTEHPQELSRRSFANQLANDLVSLNGVRRPNL
jgi:hypothetical protein